MCCCILDKWRSFTSTIFNASYRAQSNGVAYYHSLDHRRYDGGENIAQREYVFETNFTPVDTIARTSCREAAFEVAEAAEGEAEV